MRKKLVFVVGIALALVLVAGAIPYLVRLVRPDPHFLEKLPAPQNLMIENGIITWDAVEHAVGYIVDIEHTEYETKECRFDLSAYDDPGDYAIKIKACGDGIDHEDSDWSDTSFTLSDSTVPPPPKYGYDSSGLLYILLEDESGYSVYAGSVNLKGEVYIPDYYSGLPVKHIADYGFSTSSPDRNHMSVKEPLCNKVTTAIRLPAYLESIGREAFAAMTRLEEIVIPDTVTDLGIQAFYGCTSLKKVVFPKGLKKIPQKCFADTALCEIVWPEALEVIVGEAFYCERFLNDDPYLDRSKLHIDSDLASITLPSTLYSIGTRAFAGRENLETVNLTSENITFLDTFAFAETRLEVLASENDHWIYFGDILYKYAGEMPENFEAVIPDWVRGIAGGAFQGQENLKKIVLPRGVKFLGPSAFRYCPSLSEVILPDDLEIIPDSTFIETGSLKSITLPNSLKTIYMSAFARSGLESIYIPDSVTEIGISVFSGCSSLTYARLSPGIEEISNNLFMKCSSLARVEIPRGVKKLGNNAFANCTSLTKISLPDTLTDFGFEPFKACSRLESIVLPNSLAFLGLSPFPSCESLKAVYFEGTAAQWDEMYQMTIDRLGSNINTRPPFSNAVIYYYSETEPSEEGNYWHYVDGVATPWFE